MLKKSVLCLRRIPAGSGLSNTHNTKGLPKTLPSASSRSRGVEFKPEDPTKPFISRTMLNREPRLMETSVQGTQLMLYDQTTYGEAHRDINNQKALVADPIDFSHKQMANRRWLRDHSETCVRDVRRSDRLFTDYIGTFKMEDPQWSKMLALPCGNPISLEVKSRHINFSLKHLAQGQGEWNSYYVTKSVHSVLRPKGVSERCYVTCRLTNTEHFTDGGHEDKHLPGLDTTILHEGPLDGAKPNGPRGIVAVSYVAGVAGNFERREQLWMRTRRVGAMQSETGVFDYQTSYPPKVGATRPEEVMLLEPHLKHLSGGIQGVGFVSSHNMAQHDYHYVHNFEVPAGCAIDAVQQLCHRSAWQNNLVQDGEKLHWLSWRSEASFPFAPLEMDLHFYMQASTPQVYTSKDPPPPPQGAIGGPMVTGPYLQYRQYDISIGKPDYHFEDGKAMRGWNWWQQRKEFPFVGDCWVTREAHLDKLELVADIENPFEQEGVQEKVRRRQQLHVASLPRNLEKMYQEGEEAPAASSASDAAASNDHADNDDVQVQGENSNSTSSPASSSLFSGAADNDDDSVGGVVVPMDRTHMGTGAPLDAELYAKVSSRKQRLLASLKRHRGQK